MTFIEWVLAHQTSIASIVTLLVSSAWTPLVRKIPDLNLVLIVIRAILAGVPTEPKALPAKKDEHEQPIEGPIPPTPTAA